MIVGNLLDEHGAGGVTEEDAGVAIGEVEDRRHVVGADEHDALGAARLHQGGADVEAVDEARARGDQIEGEALRAEGGLGEARDRGERLIRGHRRDDDGVEVTRFEASVCEAGARRLGGHERAGLALARVREPAGLDARPADDPLVVRVETEVLIEVAVGDLTGGKVATGGCDGGFQGGAPGLQTAKRTHDPTR